MARKIKTAADWLQLINYGLAWRYYSSGQKDADWANYQRYYQGNWNKVQSVANSKYETVTVNRGFAYIRSMAPRIYYRNPKVIIKWENAMRSTLETIDNHLIQVLGIKRLMKRIVLDTLIYGIGIVKVGYNSELSVTLDEEAQKIRTEYSSAVRRGFPWAMRIHPSNFVMPFGTTELESSRWCAHRILRTVDDVKAEKSYSHTDNVVSSFKFNPSQLAASFIPSLIINKKKVRKNPAAQSNPTDELNLVELWEIRDRESGNMIVVAVGSNDILYSGTDPMKGDKYPFKIAVYNEDPTSAWGISTLRIMEPQLLELNSLRTQQSRARRTILMKILYDKTRFGNGVDLEVLFDGDDIRTAIPVTGPPEKAVKELNTHIPFDLFTVGDMIEDDLRLDVGFSRNMGGTVSKGRRSATEIATVRQSGEVTVDERRDITVDVLTDVIQAINRIVFDFWDLGKAQKIAGQNAVWAPPDTDSDYALEINPEDARAINHILMQEQATILYNTTRQDPLADPFGSLIDLFEAYKKDPQRRINPQIARAVALLIQNPQIMDRIEQQMAQQEQKQGGTTGA